MPLDPPHEGKPPGPGEGGGGGGGGDNNPDSFDQYAHQHGNDGNNPPGNTGGGPTYPGSSSSGSSSSSSSSGGSSAAAVDPVVAQKETDFAALYKSLWGEPANAAYIKHFAESGMNIWEFEDHERNKPAFRLTKTYADQADSFGALLRSWGIMAPAYDRVGRPRPKGGWPGKDQGGGGGNKGPGAGQGRPPKGPHGSPGGGP